jgi:hypothetical protein
MSLKLIASCVLLFALCACSWNSQTVNQPQQTATMLPGRKESVSFFSRIHRKIRDSERTSYSLMYDIRDGVDSFIYDVQKDSYPDYQK